MNVLDRKSLKMKVAILALALILMLQMLGALTSTSQAAAAVNANDPSNAMAAAVSYLQQQEGTDWSAFAISRAGKQVNTGYIDQLEAQVKQHKGLFTSATDLERAVLAIKSIGSDPTLFAGFNLVEALYNQPELNKSGSMGTIYGLLALDSGSYVIPTTAANSQVSLIKSLLVVQANSGGWSYTADEASSIDVTAMALTALSPYYATMPEVKKAVDLAVTWLSSQQNASGGFNEMGVNSESSAQVIIALSSLGIDPESAAFTKTRNVIDDLAAYRQADGGYSHTLGTTSNQMSTEQALDALTAYQLYLERKGTLFFHIKAPAAVTLLIEGPQSSIAGGAVTAADVLDALQRLTMQQNIPTEIVNSAYGSYVSSIQNIKAAGNDGWSYAVQRKHAWIYPQVGMADFELQLNDQIVVYYGGSTQLVHQIKLIPEQPKAGQPFTVAVEQSTWDWTANKEVITPAAGVAVQIGGQQQIADGTGEAHFTAGQAAGLITAIVTGYKTDAAPAVVKASQPFRIIAGAVHIHLDVEGSKSQLMDDNILAANTLDAVQQAALAHHISLDIQDSAYGKYLSAVGDTAANANEGWVFAVLRNHTWIYPDTGMEQFDLRPNDRVYVYYGFAAQLIQSVQFMPEQPKAGEAFQISVMQEAWDFTKNERVASPGANLTVELNHQTYVTDADGKVTIPAGLANGNYAVIISGYQDPGAPKVVRFAQSLQIYADLGHAADWAQPFIIQSGMLGLLQGTGSEGFSPAKQVTRAELATTLARMLDLPAAEPTAAAFTDVSPNSWYAKYVAAVKEQGIVAGFGNGSYAPEQKVTREQLALMLTRALKLNVSDTGSSAFRDASAAALTSIASLNAVVDAGIMTGLDEAHFDPQGFVTREMLAAVVVRAYDLIH